MTENPPRRCTGCGAKLSVRNRGQYCGLACEKSNRNVKYLPGVEKRPQPPGDETA